MGSIFFMYKQPKYVEYYVLFTTLGAQNKVELVLMPGNPRGGHVSAEVHQALAPL